jgi:hypothetical protein
MTFTTDFVLLFTMLIGLLRLRLEAGGSAVSGALLVETGSVAVYFS